jgi:hypothetical protein
MSSEISDNIVTIAIRLRGEQPRTSWLESRLRRKFCILQNFQTDWKALTYSYSVDTEDTLSRGVMRPGRETNHSTPYCIEVLQSLSDTPSWLAGKQVCFNIQFYITAPLIYSLKMASCKPKHCSCYVPLIKYILYNKVVLDYKFIYFFIIEQNGDASPEIHLRLTCAVDTVIAVSFISILLEGGFHSRVRMHRGLHIASRTC